MSEAYRIDAGLLIRGRLRRELRANAIDFSEYKGMFESIFIIRTSRARFDLIYERLRR